MEDDEVYTEWLAAAPKGVRWDKAQEMYALYQERRKAQADAVAKRLLGIQVCPACKGSDLVRWCSICDGMGAINGN